jgi:hypothetical protein
VAGKAGLPYRPDSSLTLGMTFIIVTRDELWSLERRALLESRLIHGSADQRGDTIDARDDCDDELLTFCDRESAAVREALGGLSEGRARFVVSALRESVVATISITVLDLSVVSTLPHLRSDYEMLREMASVRPVKRRDYRGVPIVWRNGTGAVLLHEAAGHPAEHGHPALAWPKWLTAFDGDSDLLAGEAPKAMRRQSFTDVPLRRMTNVVVNVTMTMPLPPRRIEILLVAGGRYEPLTGNVSLSISAADFIDGDESIRLRPFVIRESREAVARAIRGASGPTRRYPGVICTKEGQELFVGSHAPDLVTEF